MTFALSSCHTII